MSVKTIALQKQHMHSLGQSGFLQESITSIPIHNGGTASSSNEQEKYSSLYLNKGGGGWGSSVGVMASYGLDGPS
jgi:hypothetical protein